MLGDGWKEWSVLAPGYMSLLDPGAAGAIVG